MTESELIELLQSGDSDSVQAVLDRINGVGMADPKFLHAVAERFDDARSGEYADLKDDPKIWAAVQACDVDLAKRYPDASYEQRLDAVGEIARRKFGTHDSRVIRSMQAQRRNQPEPDPLSYEVPEEPDAFDREHESDISNAIEQLRKGRQGVSLDEFKRRRPGTGE